LTATFNAAPFILKLALHTGRVFAPFRSFGRLGVAVFEGVGDRLGPRRAAVNFETEPTRIAFTQGFDAPQEDDQLSQRQAGRQVPSGIRVIGNKYDSYIFIVLS
jgi:hypothetical protein